MKRNVTFLFLGLVAVAGCSEGGDPTGPEGPGESSTTRTARQAMTPVQDTNLWATPTGSVTPGNNGGPTSTCELEILREQIWTTTPPVMTGSGVTLDALDPNADGLFASSIMVRCGPFINQTADPDCEGSVTLSSGANLIGIAGDDSDAQVTATNVTWGLPGVDYSASSPKMENNELISVVDNPDGSTTVNFTCSLITDPYTDTFRMLVDYGDAFRETTLDVDLTTGADINVGGTDGGGQTTTTVVISPGVCGNGFAETGEACEDGNTNPGDGCDASCAVEPGFTCPTEGGPCLTVELGAPTDGAVLQSSGLTLSGTATPGATVTVTVNDSGGQVSTEDVVADGAGAWTASAPALTDGDYTAAASVTTTGGTTTDTADFTIDDTPPAVTVTAPADGSRGADSTPTVSGTGEAGASVRVVLDEGTADEQVVNATVQGDGSWSVDAPSLTDGTHTLDVTSTDAVGNTSAPEESDFEVDTTGPATTIDDPADNAFVTQLTRVEGSVAANDGDEVEVFIDGASVGTTNVRGNGTWSLTITQPADGTYTVRAVASDDLGNAGAPTEVTVTVDTTDPTLAVTDPADGSATNDATPDISGTSEPGALVTIVLDAGTANAQTLTTTADGAGSWTVTAATLGEGPHTVQADAQDAAGNTAPQVNTTFDVDLTGPGLTLDDPQNMSRVATLASASGTGEVGASVEVFVDGVSVGTTTVPASGVWTVAFAQPVGDGAYTVRAESQDTAGNDSAPVSATVTLDTTGPGVAIGSPTDGDTVSTLTTVSGTTTDADAASVEVFVDGVSAGSATVQAGGAWSLTLPQPADGPRTISAVASDDLGNAGAPAEVTVTVDNNAPSLTVITPTQGFVADSDTVTFSGTADPDTDIAVVVTDAVVNPIILTMPLNLFTRSDAQGDWSVDATGLADGLYLGSVTAQDALGNTTPPIERDFGVDTTAPTLTVDTPADASAISDTTPDISGTTEPDALVTVVLDAGTPNEQILTTTADGAGAWTVTPAALSEGNHTVQADAQDAAGNAAPQVNLGFEVDTTAPTVSLTSPANGDTVDPDVTVTGTSNGAEEIYVVVDEGTANERELGPVAPAANGDWTVDVTGLSDGAHTLSVRAEDRAENSATDGPITVTAQGVVLTIGAPSDGEVINDATPALVGTADPGATVTLVLDAGTPNEQTVTVQANSDGDWFLFSPTLLDGPHTLEASVDDGNGGTLTQSVSFETDTVAPGLTLDAPADGLVTSEDEPTVEGTGDAGETVEVFVDGARLGEVVVANDGTWSLPWSGAPLTEGPHTITARSSDEAGNISEESSQIIVDQNPPGLTLSAPVDGSTLADTTPLVSGQTEPGATVTVFVDGVAVGTTTADGFGGWNLELPNALTDGTYTIGAQAADAAGNTSPTQEVGVTIDSTLPVVDLVSPADGSSTSQQTPTVSGTADANATVTISIDGVDVGTATADANGDWSLDLTDALTEGDHTALASVTDGANTATDSSTFTVDLTAPALTLDTPVDGSSVNTDTPEFTGTTEPGALVELTLPDGSMELVRADASGDWSFVPTNPLAEGENTVGAVAIDEAGNRSAPVDTTFTIDITPPVVDITSPDDGSVSNDTDPTFAGTSEPDATVELFVDGNLIDTVTADADGNWSSDAGGPFADGVHTLEVVASDEAGNTARDSADFIVDTRAPDLSIDSPAQGEQLDTPTPTVTGTAEPDAVVELFVDGVKVGEATADAAGAWSFELPNELSNGDHTIGARSEDGAGNFANDEVDITINVLDMTLTVDSPAPGQVTNDTTPTISGTANPGETVEVFVDGTKLGDALADENGDWSIEVTTELSEGDHTIEASGQSGAMVGPVTFTVDTSAPVVTITSPTPGEETNDPTPTITGTGEPGAEVTVIIDGTPVGTTTVDDDGNWTFTPTDDLDDGDHTIEATVEDPAGNPGSSGEVTLTVDTTPPGVTIDTPTEGDDTGPGDEVTGTTEPGAEVVVTIDGEEVGRTTADDNGDWSITLPDGSLPSGEGTIEVTATDPAGNSSSDTVDVAFPDDGQDPGEFDQFVLAGGCGGCASAPGQPADASLLLLGLGMFAWRRRRRAA